MPNTHPPIFLSYRRYDPKGGGDHGQGFASQIRNALEQRYGKGSVFQDYDAIKGGEDWEARIPQAIVEAKAVLFLVHADQWLFDHRYRERRRLHQPGDWVRKEIVLALEHNKLILPLLVKGVNDWPGNEAQRKEASPEGLEAFFQKQYLSFDPDDIEALLRKLAELPDFQALFPKSSETLTHSPSPDLLADFPLPKQSYLDLNFEDSPYVGIAHFKAEQAALFFGRDQEIFDFYYEHLTQLAPGQVLLFHGASGVGKSSLLHAGLFPRLKHQGWEVRYDRRDKAQHLAEQLRQHCERLALSTQEKRLLILDQVEEILTDRKAGDEFQAFFEALKSMTQTHPQLKLVLGFRKEYLYEVKKALKDRRIHALEFPLHPLNQAGVARAIRGAFDTPEVRAQFAELKAASLEPELVAALSQDTLKDQHSHVAPLLQYQLQSLYQQAKAEAQDQPILLSVALYQKQASTSLKSFLEKEKLSQLAKLFPEADRLGLIEELLCFYTTDELTAATQSQDVFFQRYAHLDEAALRKLQQALIDQYLLLGQKNKAAKAFHSCRLAHDSLARIIRQRYEASSKPGQQAAFIIRAKEKLKPTDIQFSETDIEIIEAGKRGMYEIPERLYTQIQADAKRYAREKENRFQLALATAAKDLEHLDFEGVLANLNLARTEEIREERILALARYLVFPLQELEKEEEMNACCSLLAALGLEGASLMEPDQVWGAIQQRYPRFSGRVEESFYPRMLPIEGGSYKMGSEEEYKDEGPIHKVRVSDFEMAATPVTCWQYGLYCLEQGLDIPRDSGFGRGHKPVVNVNWHEAKAYCNWLSERQGLEPVYDLAEEDGVYWERNGYRLPTEAEWEYAARAVKIGRGKAKGGGAIRFGNGKDMAHPDEMNYDYAHSYNEGKTYITPSQRKGYGQTTPVRRYSPNALGLYDMSGNVNEWCWDRWSERSYYEASKGKRDPRGPEDSSEARRVVRGGSWFVSALDCRASYRDDVHPIGQHLTVGFRVVRRFTL